MRAPKSMVLHAAAAAVLAVGPALAQQERDSLSVQAVERFFGKIEQEATGLVQAGDYRRLLDWVKANVADEAVFFVSEAFTVGGQRKGFAAASLDKQDVLRLSEATVEIMSAMPEQALQDYSLAIEVLGVNPIGPNAATATTRIVEKGQFVLSGGAPAASAQASGTAGTEQARSARVEAEARAECSHLIRRGENPDQLLLGMTSCQVEIRL